MPEITDKEILLNLSDQLRLAMSRGDLTIDEMAMKLGVSNSSLSKWLAGEIFPRVGQLAKMVNLGVDVGSCFGVGALSSESREKPTEWGSEVGKTWYDYGGKEIMESCYEKPYLYDLLTYACGFSPELLRSIVELVKGIRER